ncbi:hypothetical protein [Nonomuraea sp. NPDC003804]|uniref:hypothetical protein n=1 Tax=Nonomuraea sp. NPDC003804 TaxID=3154547 RepID=UPI0033BF21D2
MGERDLTASELVQKSRRVSRMVAAHRQPGQPAAGPFHRHEQVEQRYKLRADAAGAIVQDGGEPVAEGAAFAEPPTQKPLSYRM